MELGSEFSLSCQELSEKEDNVFSYLKEYRNLKCFDSGRSVIKHIVSKLAKGGSILLPEFICESVTECFTGFRLVFYHLKEDFSIDLEDLKEKTSTDTRVLFLVHYFGAIQSEHITRQIKELSKEHDFIIIEDTTQGILSQKQTVGDYMVCSIRKWMPLPKGGLLYYQDDPLDLGRYDYPKSADNDRIYGMMLKELFLHEQLDCNEAYRNIFIQCEKKLDEQKEIRMMSDLAHFMASCFSIKEIKTSRQRNYAYLQQRLGKLGLGAVAALTGKDCPFVFPLRVPDRDQFRTYLMKNKIYCAVHWPFDGIQKEERAFAARNAKELISLPVDQRYGQIHMDYLADIITKYGGELTF